MVTARAVSAPAPISLSARLTSIPLLRPCRRASSMSAAAASGFPDSDEQIASTSGAIPGSTSRRPSRSGHRPAGSALASALWAATWVSLGVKSKTSTPDTSIRAASASPIRNSNQLRSATQSAEFSPNGVGALASRPLRSAMCSQREATGACVRRMTCSRKRPLAPPHGSAPRPIATGSSAPTKLGSRRATSGTSTGAGTSAAASSALVSESLSAT